MAGLWRISLGAFLFVLMAANADAFGGRFGMGRAPTASMSYAMPVTYWYYCPPSPAIFPVPDAPRPIYARPTPAPPSPQTAEPPLQKMIGDPRAPVVITTRSGPTPANNAERCRVGFWNVTGRDVTLTIDGKSWTLPRNQAVTLETGRQFAWQVDQKGVHMERVADGTSTHEVVLRD